MQRFAVMCAVSSMVCIQLGLAVSVGLLDRLDASGVAWLRLAWSALILVVLVRPRRADLTPTNLLLGLATAGMLLSFMGAVARLPLGTATALQFLGPLGVAVAHGQGRARLVWPGLAAAGVTLLTEPWTGALDPVGVALALAAAGFWAAYILLTRQAGAQESGLRPLAVSFPVAALAATAVVMTGSPGSFRAALDPHLLAFGAALAVLVTIVPFALELVALRHLATTLFGILMALEPALACLVGAVLLHQVPGLAALTGVLLVVVAGLGAQRGPEPSEPRLRLEPAHA